MNFCKKILSPSRIFKILILLTSVVGCQKKDINNRLQTGDILFQDLDCGPLCDAIEAVTEGAGGRDFSHCGLVIVEQDSIWVVEAIGTSVRQTSIAQFFRRSGDTSVISHCLAGRFEDVSEEVKNRAAQWARQTIGQPYDDLFLPNNGAWYCSELIAEAYNRAAKDSLFRPATMTFKENPSGVYFKAWERYFDSLKSNIPEGIPGFNPGAMSRHSGLRLFLPRWP